MISSASGLRLARSKTVLTVGTATMASSTAGAMVHMISRRVFPWIWFGICRPGRSRNLTTTYSTTMNTSAATITAST